jgi:carbon-monoxide dehydrogenase catalytic subunit
LAATNLLREGGLGEDLPGLPVAGAAPEWMSEKAVAIGHYFVASGMYVVLGHPLYVEGSENVHRLLCEEMEGITGAVRVGARPGSRRGEDPGAHRAQARRSAST